MKILKKEKTEYELWEGFRDNVLSLRFFLKDERYKYLDIKVEERCITKSIYTYVLTNDTKPKYFLEIDEHFVYFIRDCKSLISDYEKTPGLSTSIISKEISEEEYISVNKFIEKYAKE